jgi:hypothetical protein
MINYYFIIFLFALLYFWNINSNCEGFGRKPTEMEINDKINQMLTYRETFDQSMYSARAKMPWMDAIIYEEGRMRLMNDQFDYKSLRNIFN